MNGLVISVTNEKETEAPTEGSDRPLERGPTLSDCFGVVGRDAALLLPLGGGGKPTGKVKLEDPESGVCQKCGDESSG
jgi:hypothetical protein